MSSKLVFEIFSQRFSFDADLCTYCRQEFREKNGATIFFSFYDLEFQSFISLGRRVWRMRAVVEPRAWPRKLPHSEICTQNIDEKILGWLLSLFLRLGIVVNGVIWYSVTRNERCLRVYREKKISARPGRASHDYFLLIVVDVTRRASMSRPATCLESTTVVQTIHCDFDCWCLAWEQGRRGWWWTIGSRIRLGALVHSSCM